MADCKYGDPMCPCQDGDACHYESYPGSPAVACVPTEYVRTALDRLHRALKPFADLGVGSGPDHETETYKITREAIRNARAALNR